MVPQMTKAQEQELPPLDLTRHHGANGESPLNVVDSDLGETIAELVGLGEGAPSNLSLAHWFYDGEILVGE